MPNWCDNHTIVSGDADAREDFLNRINATLAASQEEEKYWKNRNLLTDSFAPMPEELRNSERGEWLEWQIENWGVKWGDRNLRTHSESANTIELDYVTPWGFPGQLWETISTAYPTLRFTTIWDAEGDDDIWVTVAEAGQLTNLEKLEGPEPIYDETGEFDFDTWWEQVKEMKRDLLTYYTQMEEGGKVRLVPCETCGGAHP